MLYSVFAIVSTGHFCTGNNHAIAKMSRILGLNSYPVDIEAQVLGLGNHFAESTKQILTDFTLLSTGRHDEMSIWINSIRKNELGLESQGFHAENTASCYIRLTVLHRYYIDGGSTLRCKWSGIIFTSRCGGWNVVLFHIAVGLYTAL